MIKGTHAYSSVQYVAFAAVGLVAGVFVEGHHLDTEHKAPVLGLRDDNEG